MINTQEREQFAHNVNEMNNAQLLDLYKELSRESLKLVGDIAYYREEDTYAKVNKLSENEHKRTIVVNRIIGRGIEQCLT